MATVKEINHDSSTTIGDHYDTVNDTDGAITVTTGAALNLSTNGVNIDYDAGSNVADLTEAFTLGTDDFRWRLRIKLDNLTNNNSGFQFLKFALQDNNPNDSFRILINGNGGDSGFNVTAFYKEDAKGGAQIQIGSGSDAISSTGEVCIELRAIRETSAGATDGEAELFIDGVSVQSISNADNNGRFAAIDRMFVEFDSSDADITGNMDYDEWLLDDDNTITTLCVDATPALGLAGMFKPADIDAAGTFIYVALLEGGTPILTKISTALNADGTTVFDPGAGDNIGVECGRFSSDTVWVAGNFDGTNVVEKSEDAGSSFAVKDDGVFGDVRSFVMGPDSDDRVLVFDETNGDILETIDDGATWTTINAAVTPEVNAIGRLGENVQESVFGNNGGANNSINYSVNSGDDLEDFQTGVYPNANATRVLVN